MKLEKRPHLNFILPPYKTFRRIDAFTEYVEGQLRKQKEAGKLNPTDAYFVLFHETPFEKEYIPTRAEVKKAVRALGELLQKEFPNVRVGFSINEQAQRGKGKTLSNTGYLVGEGKHGYKVYAKLELAGDYFAVMQLAETTSAADVEGHWHRRAAITSDVEQPFPRANFHTGHKVEYRVCADANIPTKKENIITAISASGLPPSMVDPTVLARDLVVINDRFRDPKFHTSTRRFYIDSKLLEPGSHNPHLDRRKIRFHRWK